MPEFEFEGVQMNNPVELALHLIGGKWKMPILWSSRSARGDTESSSGASAV